jgi:hypothetical protein
MNGFGTSSSTISWRIGESINSSSRKGVGPPRRVRTCGLRLDALEAVAELRLMEVV